MAIPVYLRNFKAAGIYRVVFDLSTIEGVDSEVLRLVVGYSEKGDFNSPVYITSQTEFKNRFGDISRKLEKRGVFFHRLALQALETGPILALNLKKFSNETVGAISWIPQDGIKSTRLYVEDIYDTTRFWNIDNEKMNSIKCAEYDSTGVGIYDPNKLEYKHKLESSVEGAHWKNAYLKICSISTKELSRTIFVRPAPSSEVSQYKVTVSDWYKALNKEIPEMFEGYEQTYISDYFAQVYVFNGKFIPSQVLSSTTMMKYFDGWTDTEHGNELKIRLKKCVKDAFGDNTDTLQALYEEETSGAVAKYTGALIPYFTDAQGSYASLDVLFNCDSDNHNLMMSFNEDLFDTNDASLINCSGIQNFKKNGTVDSDFLDACKNGKATSKNALGNTDPIVNSAIIDINDDGTTKQVQDTSKDNNTNFTEDSVVFCQLKEEDEITLDQLVDLYTANYNQLPNKSDFETVNDYLEKVFPNDLFNAYKNNIPVVITKNSSIPNMLTEGDHLVAANGDITYVQSVGAFEYDGVDYSFVETDDSIVNHSGYMVRVDNSLNSEIGDIQPYYLEGYTYANPRPTITNPLTGIKEPSTAMKAKLEWLKEILSTLSEYKGLLTGLCSKADIDYRYIVDTFETYPDSSIKKELSFLAKKKESAFAIINFPSAKSFVNCPYASFVTDKGVFNVQYVVSGYNKKKPTTIKFSLPTETQGASFCAFYTPLKFSDGTLDSIIPSAALVSNLFMEKYLSRQPYYIIAGPKYGSIKYPGLVGPDYNYSADELQIIEPFGVNCMVYRPKFGTYINANQTAKQTPVSGLSRVNVRELVIYLQDEIEKVLQSYQWEFNSPITRQAIKDRADQICERVKATNGIYKYLNVIDDSNNTDEVIDNEMCILSTHIEAGKGCGKMVQELTLYRTGGMSSLITE